VIAVKLDFQDILSALVLAVNRIAPFMRFLFREMKETVRVLVAINGKEVLVVFVETCTTLLMTVVLAFLVDLGIPTVLAPVISKIVTSTLFLLRELCSLAASAIAKIVGAVCSATSAISDTPLKTIAELATLELDSAAFILIASRIATTKTIVAAAVLMSPVCVQTALATVSTLLLAATARFVPPISLALLVINVLQDLVLSILNALLSAQTAVIATETPFLYRVGVETAVALAAVCSQEILAASVHQNTILLVKLVLLLVSAFLNVIYPVMRKNGVQETVSLMERKKLDASVFVIISGERIHHHLLFFLQQQLRVKTAAVT
jgi:hypothetical protein